MGHDQLAAAPSAVDSGELFSQPETRNPKRETPGRAPLRSVASAGVASGNGKDCRVADAAFEDF
jgi:hypothetical protein